MTKTIEEMYLDMDQAFEAWSVKHSGSKDHYTVLINLKRDIFGILCEYEHRTTLIADSIDDAVTKAHDYFIVKGGKL